jgi:hypothetical protein
MIVNAAGGTRGRVPSGTRKAAARHHIGHLLRYLSQSEKYGQEHTLSPTLTNCAAMDLPGLEAELEAWKTLRPGITDPVRHKIFSPEKADREPTVEEWQKMMDIYRQERGLGDAPYLLFVHADGHEGRNEFHGHLMFLRIKSDGSTVPDSLDYKVDRATARRIESELGMQINSGARGPIRSTPGQYQARRQRRRHGRLYTPAPARPPRQKRLDAAAEEGFADALRAGGKLLAALRADAARRAAGAAAQAERPVPQVLAPAKPRTATKKSARSKSRPAKPAPKAGQRRPRG